jgi:putative ABC transport system substrate-binding protein
MFVLRRRDFITLLGGAAAAWPLAARAQQPAIPVVGFLRDATAAESEFMANGLRKGLAEVGFVEGHNLTIDYAWSEGQSVRLSTLAAELVGRNVSVIVTSSNNATFAAKAATSTIPIVFAINNDPVASGLVASLNRPGGNLTGVSYLTSELGAKRLAAARSLGFRIEVFNASTESEIDTAFAGVSARGLGALLIAGNTLFTSRREHISVLKGLPSGAVHFYCGSQ